ncbi:MAG: response regulator [Desulfobacterales bacterium]|jgi:DNA-binding NtrC family response regulator|nr:MAG: response regulator [Desulfobacterales bacterium]
MDREKLLETKRILIVDDEPDVLDSLSDLLPMCKVTKATTFKQAKELLENQYFDMAILDIMGVEGYELLKICNKKRVIGVMLTAYAVTPEDIKKSYEDGAASFVPKEKMAEITTYLSDIYEAKEKGKNLWWRWFDRLADYCEKKFGPDWQKKHGFKVR